MTGHESTQSAPPYARGVFALGAWLRRLARVRGRGSEGRDLDEDEPEHSDNNGQDGPARTTFARRVARLISRDSGFEPVRGVLTPAEFERCLERERHLSDRGTRRFSVLVLSRRVGDERRFVRFLRLLRQRLRSTDLVARLDRDRVSVLLSDTEPLGADAVAVWALRAMKSLRLFLEPSIYVYPNAEPDASRRRGARDDESEGGRNGGHRERNGHDHREHDGRGVERGMDDVVSRPSNGRASDRDGPQDRDGLNGRDGPHGHDGHALDDTAFYRSSSLASCVELSEPAIVRARAAPRAPRSERPPLACAIADLWPHLCAPVPLGKRALDIAVSSAALLVLFPFLLLVALAIRLDSPGPIIFRQMRAGRGARPFAFYKFRSMHVDAEEIRADLAGRNEQSGPIFKIHDDPRITRVGRVLRRWSIDELPQLWNILMGDISLVGPRSPTFDEVAQYERWQRRRLSVIGGVTCIWQVSGRSLIGFCDWMRLDLRYIARRSFRQDLVLLARTVPAVLSGKGAY